MKDRLSTFPHFPMKSSRHTVTGGAGPWVYSRDLRNVDVSDVKNGNRKFIFHSFSALTRQIRAVGLKTMAFRFVV